MRYRVENEKIRVEILSRGAQMCSIRKKNETPEMEYLWQPDPVTWTDQAPNLFPYVGRMYGKKYEYQNREYSMEIHGFAMTEEFICQKIRPDYLVCVLEDSEETRMRYPFGFRFEIHYELVESTIRTYYIVKNKESKDMYFGLGGHPGFCVPLREEEHFEAYYLQFPQGVMPEKVLMTDTGYVLEGTEPFSLEADYRLKLHHHLFDHDAIVLCRMGHEVQLCGPQGAVAAVRYPKMDYLGLWHWPGTEVPYIFIEPWTSLPSRYEVTEKLEEKPDLIRLGAYEDYINVWEIEIL